MEFSFMSTMSIKALFGSLLVLLRNWKELKRDTFSVSKTVSWFLKKQEASSPQLKQVFV
jgi:hypothetical protein